MSKALRAPFVCFFVAFWLAALAYDAYGQTTVLHEFAGGQSDGSFPYGDLTLADSSLFGMSLLGGNDDWGTIYRMDIDGGGYQVLHQFAGGDANDGALPRGGLIHSGDSLFGMTQSGGSSYRGTIFRINADGTDFRLLHEFASGAADGNAPLGSLTLIGSTLFGMTVTGGEHDRGTIFKVETDGTGFTLLHEFAGGDVDGQEPWGSLTPHGSTLFGMTRVGGDGDRGTIFRINADGSDFALLHEFSGGDDGRNPYGNLTLGGSTLFGSTPDVGVSGELATVFRINTDGGAFEVLRTFPPVANEEPLSNSDLTLIGSTLYGTTSEMGSAGFGTIFQLNTDGSGYRVLHEFAGGENDGQSPASRLTLAGQMLFGTTRYGGDSGHGVVFSFPVPEPASATLMSLAFILIASRRILRANKKIPLA